MVLLHRFPKTPAYAPQKLSSPLHYPKYFTLWKILAPFGPIQICYVHTVLYITEGERIFWLAFLQRTNKNQVQQNKNVFQDKSSFHTTELKYQILIRFIMT